MSSSTEVLSNGSLHENGSVPRTPKRHQSKSCSSPSVPNKHVSEDVQEEIDQLLENVPQVDKFFNVINKIGSGTFSSVYVAKLKDCPGLDKLFALKHIIPTSHPSRIESELRCLYDIGGVDNVMGVQACFREKDHVVIVMPYFPHERFQDYVQLLTVQEVQEYMRNLLISLRRVHEVDIIHRDVKPSNFLCDQKSKQYALVDFGLAQKAPVPLQAIKESNPKPTESKTGAACKTKKPQPHEQLPTSPRKRKISQDDIENIPVSPRKKRSISETVNNQSVGLAIIDTNSQDIKDSKTNQETQESKTRSNNNTISPAADIMKPGYAKTAKSPRRLLLTKRTLDQQRGLCEPVDVKKRPVVVLERDGRSVYKALAPTSCMCYGKPIICSICMARSSQHAPRAGTPGFRAPEVLMKCPDQTTAVDIWAAGVIFLSLLSGRYPFFKAPDDMTALAQIISVIGTEDMKAAALSFGKNLLCSPKMPSVNLEIMCQQLRKTTRPVRKAKGDPETEKFVKDWELVSTDAYDLLKKMLNPNPNNRIMAEEALKHSYFTAKIVKK